MGAVKCQSLKLLINPLKGTKLEKAKIKQQLKQETCRISYWRFFSSFIVRELIFEIYTDCTELYVCYISELSKLIFVNRTRCRNVTKMKESCHQSALEWVKIWLNITVFEFEGNPSAWMVIIKQWYSKIEILLNDPHVDPKYAQCYQNLHISTLKGLE